MLKIFLIDYAFATAYKWLPRKQPKLTPFIWQANYVPKDCRYTDDSLSQNYQYWARFVEVI